MREINREMKQQTVERIARAQEYQKQQVLQKVEQANERTTALATEKKEMMELRNQIRKKAEREKQQVMEKFEIVKAKGLKRSDLEEMGLSPKKAEGRSVSPRGSLYQNQGGNTTQNSSM